MDRDQIVKSIETHGEFVFYRELRTKLWKPVVWTVAWLSIAAVEWMIASGWEDRVRDSTACLLIIGMMWALRLAYAAVEASDSMHREAVRYLDLLAEADEQPDA